MCIYTIERHTHMAQLLSKMGKVKQYCKESEKSHTKISLPYIQDIYTGFPVNCACIWTVFSLSFFNRSFSMKTRILRVISMNAVVIVQICSAILAAVTPSWWRVDAS